jgi:hypothetical protein
MWDDGDQKNSSKREESHMLEIHPLRTLHAALIAGPSLIAAPAVADDCTDLTKLTPPDATITTASMETGAFESPKDGIGMTTKVTETFCRVTGVARSEPTSTIGFELWLHRPINGTAACWRAAGSAPPAR